MTDQLTQNENIKTRY